MIYRWSRAELLQTRQRNPCPLRSLFLGLYGRARHSSQTTRESAGCAAEKSFYSIAFARLVCVCSAAPRRTLRLRSDRAWILLGDLPLNGHLADSVLFTPRARVGDGKLVMSGRVRRQHLHVAFQRGDGFRKAIS